MKIHPLLPLVLLTFAVTLEAAQNPRQVRQVLGRSLTLHASFDRGLDADFSRGDKTLYSFSNAQERARGGIVGLPNDDVKLVQGAGRFGNALLFTKKGPVRPFFKNEGILDYNANDWNGTVSVWLRLTPDIDLEPGYCDPVQIIGDDTNKGFIFLEWSRDENPRYFRYAIRPLVDIWDPNRVGWAALPFDRMPMVQVERAPFSRARWTHVVFTYEAINARDKEPQGKLYIDGQLQGAIENWDLRFDWDPAQVRLVLGAAYIGHLDELSVFNRALNPAEVKALYELPNGVRDLY